MTSIERLIDEANPVVDPNTMFDGDDLRSLLTLTLERNAIMDMKEITRPVSAEPRRSQAWVAVAVFAAVVIVVGSALLLFTGDRDAPPATSVTTTSPSTVPPTTAAPEAEGPVMTAEKEAFIAQFNDVVNGGDEEAFTELFDPGANRFHTAAPSLSFGLDRMIEEAQHLWNQESVITLTDCTATLSGVSCLAVRTGPVEDALAQGSFESRNVYLLTSEGKIAEIRVGNTNFDGRLDIAFREWMKATHPDVAEGLVSDSSRGLYEAFAYDDSEIYLEWAPVWAELGRPSP